MTEVLPVLADLRSKPILDSLEGIVYLNDRQIGQAELTHVPIGSPFVFVGASPAIVMAVQAGNAFVYVRIEDPRENENGDTLRNSFSFRHFHRNVTLTRRKWGRIEFFPV